MPDLPIVTWVDGMDERAFRVWQESMQQAVTGRWEAGDLPGFLDLHHPDWFAQGYRLLDGGARLRKRHIEEHIWSIRDFFPHVAASTVRVSAPDLALVHFTYSDDAGNTLEMMVCVRYRHGLMTQIHVFDVHQVEQAKALFEQLSVVDSESG